MKQRIKVLFLLFFLAAIQLKGGSPDPADRLKAVYIYNFTKFIEWPASSFSYSTAPFVIGVYANSRIGAFLQEAVSNEKVLNHPITIKYIHDRNEVAGCHILYIGETTDADEMGLLVSAIRNNVLTIGEGLNFNRNGGLIRFYTEQNKIHFSIHYELLKASGLTVSSKLLSLATFYTEK